MLETILTGVFSFIFGGGVLAYFKFYRETQKDKIIFFEEELKRYKQAYENLKFEIEKLKLALVPSPVPEWRKDASGRYVYVSPNFEIFVLLPLGLTGKDVLGKTVSEVFAGYPEFIKTMQEIDLEAIKSLRHFAVKHDVKFPPNNRSLMVIKEISQNIDGATYFVGRCYPEQWEKN